MRLPGANGGFSVPTPSDDPTLREDEDPLDIGDLELALAPAVVGAVVTSDSSDMADKILAISGLAAMQGNRTG